MMIASATADSAALTPMEKSVKNIPSYPSGKSRRLNAAKLISTLLRINSTEISIATRLRRVTNPKTPMKNNSPLRTKKYPTGIICFPPFSYCSK